MIFTTIGVSWFSLGMGLLIVQAWTVEILERLLSDDVRLFVLIQAEMVVSLALLIGTAGFAFRTMWIIVGCLGLLMGLFLSWAPLGKREALLDWFFKRPFWEYRLSGAVLLGFATALAYGIISL
jgi:hypothetical protein